MEKTNKSTKSFPTWKPQMRTESKFWLTSKRGYEALRNSSGSFIQKEDVRLSILEKCKNVCAHCKTNSNLQVDHIVSVYYAFKHKEYIPILNTFENLQILCGCCNSAKKPEVYHG